MDRQAHLGSLQKQSFDILVIGGGATGAGIALDAASRGLKVALVERDDFAAGTSSRSTKLIHGGVRYLERAVLDLDRGQYALVREALAERAILLRLAPHLARYLALLTPLYHRTEVPYYYAGLKMYDWLAGDQDIPPSRYISAAEALDRCPMLKSEGLRGGVVYYDGQFDDARMNLSIVLRASELGAVVANHVAVTGFLKEKEKLVGAKLQDSLTGGEFTVKARLILNATGPMADGVRHLDDPTLPHLLKASRGAHIILDRRFSPEEMGLLIPKTEDERVLFLLPWLGHTLVGTTDQPSQVEVNPQASAEDIDYILRQLSKYFSMAVEKKDILSSWCGLRPLVQTDAAVSTALLSREHAIEILPSGLLTIAGGKWTTYRKMAADAVDQAIRTAGLQPARPCQTEKIFLAGGAAFTLENTDALVSEFGWDRHVCAYLNRAYGDRSRHVAQLSHELGDRRLLPNHPYLEAEVAYAARFESARTSADILCRRLRLSFLDRQGAVRVLPRVQELLGRELKWSAEDRERDEKATLSFILGNKR